MSHENCLCTDGWRFEATDLGTGRVKAVLHPIHADWEEPYANVGTGTLTVATRDLAANDIWPHRTGIYISRIQPDGTRKGHFGGYVEKFNGESGGATSVALQSMDEFLDHRHVADEEGGLTVRLQADEANNLFVAILKPLGLDGSNLTEYNDSQTLLIDITETQRSGLAAITAAFGVSFRSPPLYPIVQAPYGDFSDNYRAGVNLVSWWDFKNVGAWLREQTSQEDGIKYRLNHVYADPGFWSTQMVISTDEGLSTERDYVLKSDREGWQYGLESDAKNHAQRVYGVGAGNQDTTTFSVAYDADVIETNQVEFQAAPAWKDVNGDPADLSGPVELDSLTVGYVTDHRDPLTVPSMTLAGLGWEQNVPPPEELVPGDVVGVEIGYGIITVRDTQVKVLSVGWQLDVTEPVLRTVATVPVVRPTESIRTQTPAALPAPDVNENDSTTSVTPDTGPEPEPAVVTHVTSNVLQEISGMQYATNIPGHVWVHNDEQGEPQVYLISLADGLRKGSYWPSGATRVDPEAIRLNPVTNELVLADIGDNNNNRSVRRLFVTSQPTTKGAKSQITSTVIRINYPFGAKNAECLLIHPTTGEHIVATKELGRTRFVSFGTAPTDNMTGTLLVNTTKIKQVSDGCYTLNGLYALLRCKGVQETIVVETTNWTEVDRIPTPALAKSESITMEPDGRSFLVGSEGDDSPILRVVLPKKYR